MLSAAPSKSIDAATARKPIISVFNRSRTRKTAPASATRARMGNQVAALSRAEKIRWALVMSADWKMVKLAFTVGICEASENPCATNCCFTVAIRGARLTWTASFVMVMFSVSLPVRTATSCSCAVRLAATHAFGEGR